jgi:hypothetical protein
VKCTLLISKPHFHTLTQKRVRHSKANRGEFSPPTLSAWDPFGVVLRALRKLQKAPLLRSKRVLTQWVSSRHFEYSRCVQLGALAANGCTALKKCSTEGHASQLNCRCASECVCKPHRTYDVHGACMLTLRPLSAPAAHRAHKAGVYLPAFLYISERTVGNIELQRIGGDVCRVGCG